MKKQYIGFVRDHSGSMQGLAKQAMVDFNSNLEVIQREARERDIDTLASVVECGIEGKMFNQGFRRAEVNASIERIKPLTTYPTPGGTPLFDSVTEVINLLKNVPDYADPDVAFLVMVITDGQEMHSRFSTGASLGVEIKSLQKTDRWTFTFRTPHGYGQALARQLGIPSGNIMEWEQTEQGFQDATRHTVAAMSTYYGARTMGATMSSSFYADVAQVPLAQVKRTATDISREVNVFPVIRGGEEIRPFVEKNLRSSMTLGGAFYQLTKPEPKVQPQKQIILRDKLTGKLYGGRDTRSLLGLPSNGDVKLSPGDQGQYDVFVQSTSVNRKLIAGTDVVYWEKVRY